MHPFFPWTHQNINGSLARTDNEHSIIYDAMKASFGVMFIHSRTLFAGGPCTSVHFYRTYFVELESLLKKESGDRKCQTVHDQEFGVSRQKGHVGKGSHDTEKNAMKRKQVGWAFASGKCPFCRNRRKKRGETNCWDENRGAIALPIWTSIFQPH